MKVTITNEGFRCEITESGMEIWNSEKQIYSERFEVPATAEDIPNLISQFNLFTSMRTVYTSESKVCIKRVVYYGGVLIPSAEDEKLTKRIAEASKIIGLKFLDHIIIGHHGNFYSFFEHKAI